VGGSTHEEEDEEIAVGVGPPPLDLDGWMDEHRDQITLPAMWTRKTCLVYIRINRRFANGRITCHFETFLCFLLRKTS